MSIRSASLACGPQPPAKPPALLGTAAATLHHDGGDDGTPGLIAKAQSAPV
jgi:hypothetical protein